MRYAAAYLLAILGGNLSPDVNAIVKILGSVGIECDEDRAKQVINACYGRSIEDIIASGLTKIDNMSTVNETVVSPATTVSAAVQQNAPVETNEPQSDPSTPDDDTFVSRYLSNLLVIYFDLFRSVYSTNQKIKVQTRICKCKINQLSY